MRSGRVSIFGGYCGQIAAFRAYRKQITARPELVLNLIQEFSQFTPNYLTKYAYSACGRGVQTVRQSSAKNVCNSPALCSQNVHMGTKGVVYPQFMSTLSAALPTYLERILSPLTDYLSPTSTGPIKTTTKYINNLGVIA